MVRIVALLYKCSWSGWKNVLLAAAGNTFFFSFQWLKWNLNDFFKIFSDFWKICSWFFGDVFMICFMIFSWFECRDTFPANSQPSLPRLDVLAIFRRFFIDFLSSEGRSPEARRRSHAEVAGKAVSFLLRISYIFHNFPLLSFCSPRFPFLLLQVSKYCFSLQSGPHFRDFSSPLFDFIFNDFLMTF